MKNIFKQEIIRQRIRFYGIVQGVGFRYTARNGASMLGLTGWVYNDYDGTVLMEVQGTLRKINSLIDMLDRRAFITIDRMDRNQIPTVKEWDFHIRDE